MKILKKIIYIKKKRINMIFKKKKEIVKMK